MAGFLMFCGLYLMGFGLWIIASSMEEITGAGVIAVLAALIMIGAGMISFRQGWFSSRASFEMDRSGMVMKLPAWNRVWGCTGPFSKVQLRWDEVTGVSCNKIRYTPFFFLRHLTMIVEAYQIDTRSSRYTLVKSFCPHVREVASFIAEHAGVPLQG